MNEWVLFQDVRMVYHMQINKCNTAHKQNQGQNPHNLNRCKKKKKKRKSLQQNSTFFHSKTSGETWNRKNTPQHYKGYI
jgi:hypothetical protein